MMSRTLTLNFAHKSYQLSQTVVVHYTHKATSMPNTKASVKNERVVWNRFKPSSKIFYWPFQGSTSFMFFLSCVCYAFVRVCLFVPCGHLPGKGCPLGSRLWCITVSLSLSGWYPGSGVEINCINSWSLHPYLHLNNFKYIWLLNLRLSLIIDLKQ